MSMRQSVGHSPFDRAPTTDLLFPQLSNLHLFHADLRFERGHLSLGLLEDGVDVDRMDPLWGIDEMVEWSGRLDPVSCGAHARTRARWHFSRSAALTFIKTG